MNFVLSVFFSAFFYSGSQNFIVYCLVKKAANPLEIVDCFAGQFLKLSLVFGSRSLDLTMNQQQFLRNMDTVIGKF